MSTEKKSTKSFPLRLSVTMRRQLEYLAKQDGISINQFICLAMAEKITRLDQDMQRTEGKLLRNRSNKPLVHEEFSDEAQFSTRERVSMDDTLAFWNFSPGRIMSVAVHLAHRIFVPVNKVLSIRKSVGN